MNVRLLAAPRAPVGARAGIGRIVRLRPPAALSTLILPLLVLALWQLAASHALLPVQILPPPALVLNTLADLTLSGDIFTNLGVSLWRIGIGIAIGCSLGLALGTVMGLSQAADDYISPLFRALAQIPSLGWVPILILIFGLDEIVKYLIIAKACFVPTTIAMAEGIRNIPRSYKEVATVLGLGRRATIRKLIVPAALPTIFGGLRLAFSHAWIALIVVEMLAAQEGVGYMMVWGRTLFQTDIVIAGMIVIGVIGLAMDSGLRRLERRLRRWAVPA